MKAYVHYEDWPEGIRRQKVLEIWSANQEERDWQVNVLLEIRYTMQGDYRLEQLILYCNQRGQ